MMKWYASTMKTTKNVAVAIPEAIWLKLKRRALKERTTVKALVVAALSV